MEREIDKEQAESTAQAAEAEEVIGATAEEVSFGKFKDAKSLVNAYNSLQAEFTRRSQRLKALEGALEKADKDIYSPSETRCEESSEAAVATFLKGYPKAESYIAAIKEKVDGDYRSEKLIGAYAELLQDEKEQAVDEDKLSELALKSPLVRELVIKNYLKDVAGKAPAAVIMADGGGAMVASPPKKPKSVSEAGELAYELFKNKDNKLI